MWSFLLTFASSRRRLENSHALRHDYNKLSIMSRLGKILRFVRATSALKYVVVLILGVAIVGFLDENSVWSHIRNSRTIDGLQAEIKAYRQQYERDKAQLRRLDTDPKAIEKIARERYFMKMDDEDIFVLSDDETNQQTLRNETAE